MSYSMTDTASSRATLGSSLFSQRIFGMSLPMFAIALAVMVAAIATDTLPSGMIGALLVMMLLGELLGFIGDRLPIVKSYLGGGAILAIFGAAAMVYLEWLPTPVVDNVTSFMIGQVIDAISVTYVLIVFAVVAGAAFGAGLVGKLVGFYPIESAITAGLCMANMGGTGDVAVLSAARRMSLMPFAQISSRLGGALILLISSVVVPLFFV